MKYGCYFSIFPSRASRMRRYPVGNTAQGNLVSVQTGAVGYARESRDLDPIHTESVEESFASSTFRSVNMEYVIDDLFQL